MPLKFLARLLPARRPESAGPAPAPGAPFALGALVDQRYRLEAEIGRGGMGIVYRAYDLPHQRPVALKVINLEQANALTRQQFAREAQIVTQLQHPHIVAVYEIGAVPTGASEPAPFIVMEWSPGVSLEAVRGLTYARIIDLGRQICQALEYAHGQGFVHRDLKPGNVLVEKRGFHYFAKLADFGLARPRGAANLPAESNRAGTVFYLAPEVIAGQPADVASDLYALGAMLYEMITGRVPFSNFDEQAILVQHLRQAVAPPSHSREDVPPELDAIVTRLLAKDPCERYASAHEVDLALEQAAQARAASAGRGHLPPGGDPGAVPAADLAQLECWLETSPLVTLLGDGQALALAAGAHLSGQFADGVWWVELETIDAPALAPEMVAAALGVRADPRRALTVSLVEHLREKNLLLILSHCGHLLGACAQLADTVRAQCPDVRILATSSQPLNLPAEQCQRV